VLVHWLLNNHSRSRRRGQAFAHGAKPRHRTNVEALESRSLLAVSAALFGFELLIRLTETGDTAALAANGGMYEVRSGIRSVGTFSVTAIESIRVTGDIEKASQSFVIRPGDIVGDSLTVESGVDETAVYTPISTTGSVQIDSARVTLARNIITSGNQSYAGIVRIAQDVIVDAGASDVRFSGPLRSTVGLESTLAEGVGSPFRLTVSPSCRDLYASDTASGRVSLFDLATTQSTTIDLGKSVGDVLLSATGSRLYVANPAEGSVTVLDTGNRRAVATIMVGGTPRGMAISADGQFLYVTNYTLGEIAVIDVSLNVLARTTPVPGGPHALAFGPDGRLWVVATDLNRVSVVNPTTGVITANLAVGRSPADIAISPDGRRGYIPSNQDGTLAVIDTTATSVVTTIPIGTAPTAVAATPDGKLVYVVDGFENTVIAINGANYARVTTIPVWPFPAAIVLSADGKTGYVSNETNLPKLVDAPRALTVRTSGTAQFDAVANSVDPLRSLTVDAGRQVGPPPPAVTIESIGNTSVRRAATGVLLPNSRSINAGGLPVNENPYRLSGWTAVAAETVANVNTLAWQNTSGQLRFWRLNPDWMQLSADSLISPRTPEFWSTESTFGVDFDRDGTIGAPNTLIESIGGVSLAYTA
jgi:YVTN family beta-propeller protein